MRPLCPVCLLILLVLCSCGTYRPFVTAKQELRVIGININKQETRTVGEPVVVKMEGLFQASFLAIVDHEVPGIIFKIPLEPVKAGDLFKCRLMTEDGEFFYCGKTPYNNDSVCVVIDNRGQIVGRGRCDWAGFNDVMETREPRQVFKRHTEMLSIISGVRQELVYNGKSGSTIKLQYREFNNDMIRPAFSQDLSYDLSDSKVIGFRGMKIEILNATNTDISFVVRTNMN